MKDFPFDPYDFFGYLAGGLLILAGLEFIVGVPNILGKDLKPLDLTIVTLAAYIVGQITATPAQWFLENLIVGRILKSPSVNLMRGKSDLPLLRFVFPGHFKPLPESVQQRILDKAKSEGLVATDGEDLFLHIRFRRYVRNDTVLMGRLNSFLSKYGFNRNLSFAAFVFCAAVLLATPFDFTTKETRYALLAGITSVLLFYRYIKFFRQYSYELFNSYAGEA